MMLDKGQEDDWFSSRFIVTAVILTIVAFAVFLWRELRVDHPIVDLRLFKRRNVAMTQLVMFMVGASLYSTTVLIPQYLQEVMGYSARQAGMAISTGGLVLMVLFPVAGALAPKFDPRKLVAFGFVVTTYGLYRMTNINQQINFGLAVSWRAVIALGLPFLFIPINTLCYSGIPQEKNNDISGLTALSRNVGGSVGISFVTTLLARLSQRHQAMLIRHTVEGNGPFDRMKSGMANLYSKNGWRGPDSTLHAGAQIYGMMLSQARTLAYVDVIWILVFLTGCLIPLPFLMNKPKKGARSAEPVH
jgi:DHA2 family multidrug resistance protein